MALCKLFQNCETNLLSLFDTIDAGTPCNLTISGTYIHANCSIIVLPFNGMMCADQGFKYRPRRRGGVIKPPRRLLPLLLFYFFHLPSSCFSIFTVVKLLFVPLVVPTTFCEDFLLPNQEIQLF
eukprot:TRINITY_DN9693_c0_g2_i1.p1 TRINITY_DN9693_c0_g2~~TRINITY_DN9693_c0_g2_i1.p1  ORF type:complete len:124 (+),score=2.97 TRINITY_DN9693_c0_g2_i1:279-650(+)